MKIFGIIFAVFAVASAKHLGSHVQTRTVETKESFVAVIWSVGKEECDPADKYLTPFFEKMGDPVISQTYQPIIDSHIYFHNLGSNVGGLFYEPYTDSSSTKKLKDEFRALYHRVAVAVSLAKEKGVAGADELDKRRTKCNYYWEKAGGDLYRVVSGPEQSILDAVPLDVLNEILTYFEFAASLMNDTVIALSKQLSGSN